MKFTQTLLFGLVAGLAGAAPLERRDDEPSVLKDIASGLVSLAAHLEDYINGVGDPSAILGDVSAVESDLDLATTQATKAGKYDKTESSAIFVNLKALSTDTQTVLQDIAAGKDAVGVLKDTVAGIVTTIKAATDGMFIALTKAMTSNYTSQVSGLHNKVDKAFTDVLTIYS